MRKVLGTSVALWIGVAVAWPQQQPAVVLEEVKGIVNGLGDDAGKIAYAIRVPKNSQFQQQMGDVQHVYSSPFNSFVGWMVEVEKTRVGSLEEAVRQATRPGVLAKPEGRAIEGGFEVAMKPTSPQVAGVEVYTYKVGRKSRVRAHCSGPSKELATVIEMCNSLKLVE